MNKKMDKRNTNLLFLVVLSLTGIIYMTGCGAVSNKKENNYALTPMVMIDGKLYYPLGRGYVDENHYFDGTIKSTVDSNEIPTENEQSNFGSGYGYRYTEKSGVIEIFMSDKWYEYSTNEADMSVTNEHPAEKQRIELKPSVFSYYSIVLMLPADWDYEIQQTDDVPVSNMSINIKPKKEEGQYISIGYSKNFGVCGTGLSQEEIDLNGHPAWKGTYDNYPLWNFIVLKDENSDCVIINHAADTWSKNYEKEIDEILSTVEFNIKDKLVPDGEIVNISACTRPESIEYTYDDCIDIQNIKEYFNSLDLDGNLSENPGDRNGMSWALTFKYADNHEVTLYYFDEYILNAEGQWFRVKHEQAEKFDEMLSGIELFKITPSKNKVEDFERNIGEMPYTVDGDECYNIVPQDISEKYGFDIFKFDKSYAGYLMYNDKIYSLGSSFGGYGLTAFAIADLNKDGMREIYFTFSWGSGIYRSQIGYFDMAAEEVKIFDYSNEDNDMSFYVDSGKLQVYNARVTPMGSTLLKIVNLKKVGEIVLDEGEIKFNAR